MRERRLNAHNLYLVGVAAFSAIFGFLVAYELYCFVIFSLN